ncbi:Vps62-related protein [Clostridium sp. CMCC3677]|uniref:Vps62-related protein n=1 Tax=Clostridium sp. CMCC3677 TaxID=2949963 RepID=UPI0013F06E24|nr:Vps62-related protein [Clostridium sp. CMCC3677]NFG60525.1 DUF946 domain-containing protein [Clostridium botulinum]NFQ09832.1 DUF946 domain-containing protein [Clostridium botulinum]
MKNCYKRILIMFVMTLTIMGVGAFQNKTIANAETLPKLELKEATKFSLAWNDRGSGGKYDGAFYRLTTDTGYVPVGYYGQENYNDPNSDVLKVLTVKFTDGITVYPIDYKVIWNDKGSGANMNGYFWEPIAPEGYVAMGMIVTNGSKPLEKDVVCIKEEYTEKGCAGKFIWDDTNTGSATNFGSWSIDPIKNTNGEFTGVSANTFVGITSLDKNSTTDNPVLNVFKKDLIVNTNESISLDHSIMNLTVNDSKQLTATTTPSAVDINWSSSDETVATVDSNGNVKAIKEGQATITSQIKGTDIKANCMVTVTKEDKEPEPIDPEQEYIINTAYAKGDNTNNASGQVSIIFRGVTEAQLKVVKTADVDSVYVGDNFTYTIEVTNTSDKTAKSVVINDSAPNHIQFIPNGVTTTQGLIDSSSTSKSIIVNVGDIPPSGTVIIKIPVLVVE